MPEQDKDERLIAGEATRTPSSDEAVSAVLDRIKQEISGMVDAPRIDVEPLSPRIVSISQRIANVPTEPRTSISTGWGNDGPTDRSRKARISRIALGLKAV